MMDVVDIKVRPFSGRGKTVAFVNLTFGDENTGEGLLVVDGFTVVDGSKGLFLGSPRRYSKKRDEWFDTAFFIDRDFREQVQERVIEAYQQVSDGEQPRRSRRRRGSNQSTSHSRGRRPQEPSVDLDDIDLDSLPEPPI